MTTLGDGMRDYLKNRMPLIHSVLHVRNLNLKQFEDVISLAIINDMLSVSGARLVYTYSDFLNAGARTVGLLLLYIEDRKFAEARQLMCDMGFVSADIIFRNEGLHQ